MTRTSRNRRDAFLNAIRAKVLSDTPKDIHFAGKFLYLWTENGRDHFKHAETDEHLSAPIGAG